MVLSLLVAVGGCRDFDIYTPQSDGGTAGSAPATGGGGAQGGAGATGGVEAVGGGGTGGATGGGGGAAGGEGGTGGGGGPVICDDFRRADNVDLGNGWIEKYADAFSLVGGEAAPAASSPLWLDDFAYRPPADEMLDMEVSVGVRLTLASVGYPTLVARAPASMINNNGYLGYILFFPDSHNSMAIQRQEGGSSVTIGSMGLSESVNTTDHYRMRMRVVGTDPVAIDTWLEKHTGASWVVLGSSQDTDSDSNRITTSGTFGMAADQLSQIYDNFCWQAL